MSPYLSHFCAGQLDKLRAINIECKLVSFFTVNEGAEARMKVWAGYREVPG